jgi:integrase
MLTGMRRGELCGIQWSDIDWEGSRLTVRRSVWQIRSTWGLKDPKTHQVRTIALDPVTVAVLTARKARADSEAATACVPLSNDAFVWSTLADGLSPRTPNSLTRAFHRLCRTMETEALAADPPRVESWKFRFHDLRHLSATEMEISNVAVFASFRTDRDEVPPGEMSLRDRVGERSSRDEVLVGAGIHRT